MADTSKAVVWEAPEHYATEKNSDWFWVLGIIAFCGAVAAFFFGNFLFSILILIGAGTMALQASRPPRVVTFMVGHRGIRVGDSLYTYSSLKSYCINEEDYDNPQLLVRSKHAHLPLISMFIPAEHLDEVEALLKERLEEEELEESFAQKILELFGF